jgi:hypothetical protein
MEDVFFCSENEGSKNGRISDISCGKSCDSLVPYSLLQIIQPVREMSERKEKFVYGKNIYVQRKGSHHSVAYIGINGRACAVPLIRLKS